MAKKSEKVEPVTYFKKLKEYPYWEQLAKAGLNHLVNEMIITDQSVYFKESNSLSHALGIDKFRLNRLRDNKGGIVFLQWLVLKRDWER